jgi:hypothetical protein
MPKIFVDGSVFDSHEHNARDIEDVLYGEEPSTLTCDSPEEFYAAAQEYSRAQIISTLQHIEGYQALQQQLDEEAQMACESENSYRGLDKDKKEKLWLDRVIKTSIRDRIRQIVSDASGVQKPILREQ